MKQKVESSCKFVKLNLIKMLIIYLSVKVHKLRISLIIVPKNAFVHEVYIFNELFEINRQVNYNITVS